MFNLKVLSFCDYGSIQYRSSNHSQTRERDTEPENDTADVHSAPLQVSNNCLVVLLSVLALSLSCPIRLIYYCGWVGHDDDCSTASGQTSSNLRQWGSKRDLIKTDGGQYCAKTKIMEINLQNAFTSHRNNNNNQPRFHKDDGIPRTIPLQPRMRRRRRTERAMLVVELNRPFFIAWLVEFWLCVVELLLWLIHVPNAPYRVLSLLPFHSRRYILLLSTAGHSVASFVLPAHRGVEEPSTETASLHINIYIVM